jgi:hypothetical protein
VAASVAFNTTQRRLYPASWDDPDAEHAFPWALDKYTQTVSSHYRRQLAVADVQMGVGMPPLGGVDGTFAAWDGAGAGRGLAIASSPSVSNPIVCISQGDSIVFDVSNTKYPVYAKVRTLLFRPS